MSPPSVPIEIAVIVRTAGRSPLFLRRALNSILGQSMRPTEVVVVDDSPAPTLSLEEISQGFETGPRLTRVVRDVVTQPEPNRSLALNRGVAACRSAWLAFLDDDDTWKPEFLESMARVVVAHAAEHGFGGAVSQTEARGFASRNWT